MKTYQSSNKNPTRGIVLDKEKKEVQVHSLEERDEQGQGHWEHRDDEPLLPFSGLRSNSNTFTNSL